jgi:hypothetical protein
MNASHHGRAAVETLRGAVVATEAAFRALQIDSPAAIARVEVVVESLIVNLKTSDSLLIPLLSGGAAGSGAAHTAVDVTILSLRMGMELRYAHPELSQLGLVAMLHNAGRSGTPVARLGLAGPAYAQVAHVVAHAQELVDGRAPAGRRGARAHEHAEIVALAALYESLSRQQPTGPRAWPPVAVKEILRRARARFADEVLKALIQITVSFPVGGLVRLNSGEIACVVERNDGLPLRPVVSIEARRGRRLADPKLIDLRENPFLYVCEFLGYGGPERELEDLPS